MARHNGKNNNNNCIYHTTHNMNVLLKWMADYLPLVGIDIKTSSKSNIKYIIWIKLANSFRVSSAQASSSAR